MKKMKFTAAILAAALVMAAMPSVPSSALDNGYRWRDLDAYTTLVTPDSDFGLVLQTQNKKDSVYYVSQDPTRPELYAIIEVSTFCLNYTEIVTQDAEAVMKLYEKYENALGFTNIYTVDALVNGEAAKRVRMYHEITGEEFNQNPPALKKPLVQKFCQELEETGAAVSAKYVERKVYGANPGFGTVYFSDFAEDTEAVLNELLDKYRIDFDYDWFTPEVLGCSVTNNVTFGVAANIIRDVLENYPDAEYSAALDYMISSDNSGSGDVSEAIDIDAEGIDLLNNEPAFTFGDIDSDNDITTNDAFQTLQYASAAHAGGTPLFTDGTDAYAEASAFAAADVNLDGAADESDAFGILMYTSYRSLGKEATWEEVLNNPNI